MGKSYRVAILGSQGRRYGLNVLDLDVEQICSILESQDINKGIAHEKLGVQPGLSYQVFGGGRFYPSVSRQKVAETMQGVEILIAVVPTMPSRISRIHGRNFYRSLIEENLLDECSLVVARIVDNYDSSRHTHSKPDTDPKTILEKQTMDFAKFQEKLRIISDTASEGVSQEVALLRSDLVGEELKEKVTQPVKETLSAGKAFLDAGQRISGWIGSLVKASPAA